MLNFDSNEWHIILLLTSTLVYHSPWLCLSTKHHTWTVHWGTQIIPASSQLIFEAIQPHHIPLTRSLPSLDLVLSYFPPAPSKSNFRTLQVPYQTPCKADPGCLYPNAIGEKKMLTKSAHSRNIVKAIGLPFLEKHLHIYDHRWKSKQPWKARI